MNWKMILLYAALATTPAATAFTAENRPPEAPAPGSFGESEYRLGPEDQLQFFVWKEPDLSTTVVVRPDGKVSLPLIGEIEAVGKTAKQLQEETTKRLHQFVTDPVVSVIVTQVNSPKISVLGQVKRPDMYRLKQRMTVLDAIALAGGFTEYADRDKVVIIRNGKWGVQRIKLNLKPLIQDGKNSLAYVQPADTVYVE
jgi:polysaccharide export outer membrane protein